MGTFTIKPGDTIDSPVTKSTVNITNVIDHGDDGDKILLITMETQAGTTNPMGVFFPSSLGDAIEDGKIKPDAAIEYAIFCLLPQDSAKALEHSSPVMGALLALTSQEMKDRDGNDHGDLARLFGYVIEAALVDGLDFYIPGAHDKVESGAERLVDYIY